MIKLKSTIQIWLRLFWYIALSLSSARDRIWFNRQRIQKIYLKFQSFLLSHYIIRLWPSVIKCYLNYFIQLVRHNEQKKWILSVFVLWIHESQACPLNFPKFPLRNVYAEVRSFIAFNRNIWTCFGNLFFHYFKLTKIFDLFNLIYMWLRDNQITTLLKKY